MLAASHDLRAMREKNVTLLTTVVLLQLKQDIEGMPTLRHTRYTITVLALRARVIQ